MIDKKEIRDMLALSEESGIKELFAQAYKVKLENVGKKVYFRGIIELSNICTKNCFYCGIRRDNKNLQHYDMPDAEVIEAAMWAYDNLYGSVVLQSGERSDKAFTARITGLLQTMMQKSDNKLGITLSLGEQTSETYREWYNAGAKRYLLRIETTNQNLYKKLHPQDHTFQARIDSLHKLREEGYQVGTGVMIGLPGQTIDDLADDVAFFRDFDVDMIGMGPYIPHQDTPLYTEKDKFNKEENLLLALKMIAVCRIVLKDINIASTTALQALDPQGREMGLQAGANIIMPVITDIKYRSYYQLYEGKPCMDENATQCRSCLQRRIESVGEEIGYNQWGDSPHFLKKKQPVE